MKRGSGDELQRGSAKLGRRVSWVIHQQLGLPRYHTATEILQLMRWNPEVYLAYCLDRAHRPDIPEDLKTDTDLVRWLEDHPEQLAQVNAAPYLAQLQQVQQRLAAAPFVAVPPLRGYKYVTYSIQQLGIRWNKSLDESLDITTDEWPFVMAESVELSLAYQRSVQQHYRGLTVFQFVCESADSLSRLWLQAIQKYRAQWRNVHQVLTDFVTAENQRFMQRQMELERRVQEAIQRHPPAFLCWASRCAVNDWRSMVCSNFQSQWTISSSAAWPSLFNVARLPEWLRVSCLECVQLAQQAACPGTQFEYVVQLETPGRLRATLFRRSSATKPAPFICRNNTASAMFTVRARHGEHTATLALGSFNIQPDDPYLCDVLNRHELTTHIEAYADLTGVIPDVLKIAAKYIC